MERVTSYSRRWTPAAASRFTSTSVSFPAKPPTYPTFHPGLRSRSPNRFASRSSAPGTNTSRSPRPPASRRGSEAFGNGGLVRGPGFAGGDPKPRRTARRRAGARDPQSRSGTGPSDHSRLRRGPGAGHGGRGAHRRHRQPGGRAGHDRGSHPGRADRGGAGAGGTALRDELRRRRREPGLDLLPTGAQRNLRISGPGEPSAPGPRTTGAPGEPGFRREGDGWFAWGGGNTRRTGDYRSPLGSVEGSQTALDQGEAGFGLRGDRATLSAGVRLDDSRYGVPLAGMLHGAAEGEQETVDVAMERRQVRTDFGFEGLGDFFEAAAFTVRYSEFVQDEIEMEGNGPPELETHHENRSLVFRGELEGSSGRLRAGSERGRTFGSSRPRVRKRWPRTPATPRSPPSPSAKSAPPIA